MSAWGIGICTVIYFLVSIDHIIKKDYPHGLMWFAYSLANIGLLWHYIRNVQ